MVSHLELPEVISPELVLIDPELAQIARRRLPERPPPPALAPRREVVPERPVAASMAHTSPIESRSTVRHSARALHGHVTHTIPALVIGAVLLGMLASELRVQFLEDPASLVAPAVSTEPARVQAPAPRIASETEGPSPQRTVSPAAAAPEAVGWLPTKSEVEVRALAALNPQGPLRVPSGLIDKRTGLFLDNVHVSCRRVGRTVRFACTVGAGPSQPQTWQLTVVTSRHGTWRWQGLDAPG